MLSKMDPLKETKIQRFHPQLEFNMKIDPQCTEDVDLVLREDEETFCKTSINNRSLLVHIKYVLVTTEALGNNVFTDCRPKGEVSKNARPLEPR